MVAAPSATKADGGFRRVRARRATKTSGDQHHISLGVVVPVGVSRPPTPLTPLTSLTGVVARAVAADDVPRVATGRGHRRNATTFGNNVLHVATGRRPARGGAHRRRGPSDRTRALPLAGAATVTAVVE